MKKIFRIFFFAIVVLNWGCNKIENNLIKLTNATWKLKGGNLILHEIGYLAKDTVQSTFGTIEEKTFRLNFIQDSINKIDATGSILVTYQDKEDECFDNYLKNYSWQLGKDKIFTEANANFNTDWIFNIDKIKNDRLELTIDTIIVMINLERHYHIEYFFDPE